MAQATFAAAINCIDGRVQAPVTEWMRERFGVQYVDLITAPGADGLLALYPDRARERLRAYVEVSVGGHGTEVVAVTGHAECLGNPVSEAEHREHLQRAVATVLSWQLRVKVIALWVGDGWRIDVVKTRSAVVD